MRLIQVTIPMGKRDAILASLDDGGFDYVLTDETSGREYTAVAYVPAPQNAVEPLLERLREVGVDDEGYTVIVEANTVVSRRFEDLQEEYEESDEDNRIAREELVSKARSLAPPLPTYVVMTVVSAVIATAGLLLDSPAVVVGSMVIAPLIGPAMATSVGTVTDERDMFHRGVKLQVLGLVVSVASAALFALFLREARLVPPIDTVTSIDEIRERVAPDFLSLAVALGAGVAGVVSLTSGVSTALVGVMIAVALIPPAAVVGIGLAWGEPVVTVGSSILLLVNVLSINMAALIVLWYLGYRPQRWFRTDEARTVTIRRIASLALAIVVLSAFLGGVTVDSVQRAQTEDALTDEVRTIVGESGGTFISLSISYNESILFGNPDRVDVVVGYPVGVTPPSLAEEIDAAAERIADAGVRTRVQYRAIQSTA